MHTSITETITSGKSWGYIKDLLQLKICNSDIHTSIYHALWRYSKKKMNPSQHTSTILNREATEM